MTWTKDAILAKLETSDKMVARSLVVMLSRQTSDEQASKRTAHNNGRGFTGVDAGFLTDLAQRVQQWEAAPVKKYASPLSPKQTAAARKSLRKYAGQLVEEANAKAEASQ